MSLLHTEQPLDTGTSTQEHWLAQVTVRAFFGAGNAPNLVKPD